MSTQHTGQVIRDYQTEYPDPITVQAGERLEISERVSHWNGNPAWRWVWCTDPRGKSGWVPQSLIATTGQIATARYDYAATELTASAGETLHIAAEESGWLWCTNQQGAQGWIPADHVSLLPASS